MALLLCPKASCANLSGYASLNNRFGCFIQPFMISDQVHQFNGTEELYYVRIRFSKWLKFSGANEDKVDLSNSFIFNPTDSPNLKIVNVTLRCMPARLSAIGLIFILIGCHTPDAQISSATPCLKVLDRFTAADVPEMGPAEIESPPAKWADALTPATSFGHGLVHSIHR